jgi:copper chaperone CopZ
MTTFPVEGMHCPACVQRLTEAFAKVPGVASARVTLSPPEVRVESEEPVGVDVLDRAARGAGSYSVGAAGLSIAGAKAASQQGDGSAPSLYPLGLIVAFIAGTAGLATFVRGGVAGGSWRTFMLDFMAGFFLVFSFFKLLDVRGFADAYRSYDIVARRSRAWALAYPFVELGLGVAYLIRWELMIVNVVALVLMLIGSIGVLRALARKDRIRCACLGTALNLPMTTVTLVEDLVMAGMAGAMLVWGH